MELPVDAEPAAVMAAAIAAWRVLRHPRLAELVDRIEERLLDEAPRPPLGASKRHADVAAWREVEAAGDPLDLRRLGEAAGCGAKADVLRQVKALAARPDPRLARALLGLLERPPYAGAASRPLLGEILEELAATRDRRAAGPAGELADRYLGVASTATGRWMIGELRAVAGRLEAAEHAELPEALAAACAALEARLGIRAEGRAAAAAARRTLGELLAEVYAAPDDDGPRLVYADALLERGDPRGELIALQIARARGAITDEGRAREAELLADDARLAAWAQPVSTAGDVTFERGFPAVISLRRDARPTTDDPAWAAITGVREISRVGREAAARICALPSLRSVETLSVPFLEELCRTPRPWTRVGVDGARAPSAAALAALPELRALELRVDEPPPRAHLAHLALRELSLRTGSRCEALDLPPTLERLHVTARGAPPRMDLARLAQLRELSFEYSLPGAPLALPASLERLELRGPSAAPPGLSIAPPAALRWACIVADSIEADALRELASLEELYLVTFAGLPAGALDPLVRLRRLALTTRNAPLPPRAFARLAALEELHVIARHTAEPQLDGLPISNLTWRDQPLDLVPPGLPLRRAAVSVHGELDPLERFLARYPALDHLELEVMHPTQIPTDDRKWRRLVELLERSPIQVCVFGPHYDPIALERDAAGLMSRMKLQRGDARAAEILARALTRVTSIESASTKVPRKLAKLVR